VSRSRSLLTFKEKIGFEAIHDAEYEHPRIKYLFVIILIRVTQYESKMSAFFMV